MKAEREILNKLKESSYGFITFSTPKEKHNILVAVYENGNIYLKVAPEEIIKYNLLDGNDLPETEHKVVIYPDPQDLNTYFPLDNHKNTIQTLSLIFSIDKTNEVYYYNQYHILVLVPYKRGLKISSANSNIAKYYGIKNFLGKKFHVFKLDLQLIQGGI